MTAFPDLDRQLDAFLLDGPTDLPDPSFDAVRDSIEHTRQRVGFGPWRSLDMNKFAAIGLGAAAVVVAVIVGAQLLGPSTPNGVGTSPTSSPTAAPSSSASPSVSAAVGVPLGTFRLLSVSSTGAVPVTVTIPASGWFGDVGGGLLTKMSNPNPPDGAGLIVFTGDLYVYGDPCNWATTKPEKPATTVDELMAALSAQASRDASSPVDVTVDGHAGKSITLHVPDDAAFSTCDQATFGSWTVPGGTDPYRYHQGPGQIDEVWAVDVDGVPTIIDFAYYEGTPQSVVSELRAIAESATFGS